MGCHPARVRVSWLNLLSLLLALRAGGRFVDRTALCSVLKRRADARFLYFRAVVTITGVGPSVVGAVVAACALRRASGIGRAASLVALLLTVGMTVLAMSVLVTAPVRE
jgi:hypothetical protein